MQTVATIGAAAACCGLLFFLVCVGLVVWYLFHQPPQVASDTTPEPPVQATIEHQTAGATAPEPSMTPTDTPGADG